MTTRRRVTSIAVLICGAFVLGGCTGSDRDSTTLRYAIWDPNQKAAMEQIAAEFTAENPEVSVEVQLTPYADYFTKLETTLTSAGGADVFWLNPMNLPLYAASGSLTPLRGIDAQAYPDALVEMFTYQNQLYGAPKDFDTIGLWYNQELFDTAGIEYPTADWTWQDMTEAAKATADPKAGIWGIVSIPLGQTHHYNTIAQAGGEVISADGTTANFDTPEALAGVEVWTDLIESGAAPTIAQVAETDPNAYFQSGKVAMLPNGSWAAAPYAADPDLADIVDVVPLPKGPTSAQSVINGLANVVNAHSEDQDAAIAFAAFASGKRAAEIQAEQGVAIPAYQGTQDAWLDSVAPFNGQVFLDAVATAVPFPVSRNTSGWTSIEYEMLTQIWAGAVPVEAGLRQLDEQVQAELDEELPE